MFIRLKILKIWSRACSIHPIPRIERALDQTLLPLGGSECATWCHFKYLPTLSVPLGANWCHLVPLHILANTECATWCHLVPLHILANTECATWCHLVPLGATWCHCATWCHLVPLQTLANTECAEIKRATNLSYCAMQC